MKLPKFKKIYLLMLLFSISGCAGPKIATDLLANVRVNESPLTNSASSINVTINPRINNMEELDKSVKQSLEIALVNANMFIAGNLFVPGSLKPYKINANILVASQSTMSFGSFPGKLKVHYVVYNSSNNIIFDKEVFTEAASDKWFFSGAKRHRRSRAVTIAKNVMEFVDILQNLLQKK